MPHMDNKKRNVINLIVWAILALCTLVFIYSNSLKNGPESMKQSSVVVEVVEPIIDPNHTMSEDLLTTIVRKGAHFTEFFLLGLTLRMMFIYVSRLSNKKFFVTPFFVCLFAAVIDEFIQSFTERTSAVLDVLIDFSGSTLAILLVMMVMLVIHLIRKRKYQTVQ